MMGEVVALALEAEMMGDRLAFEAETMDEGLAMKAGMMG